LVLNLISSALIWTADECACSINSSGTALKRSGNLSVGYGAEVSYRQANGNFYICNGGMSESPTHVYEVDMNQKIPAVKRTIDFSNLGPNGMVAVNNSNGACWYLPDQMEAPTPSPPLTSMVQS
jgi:hypothetical protein